MGVLDIYGFHEADMQKAQDSCIDALLVAREALEGRLGIEAKELHDLEQNFESKVKDRYEQVAKLYAEVHNTDTPSLDSIGECMIASMLYETAYTLNGQGVFKELNLASYGTDGLRLNGEDSLRTLLESGTLFGEIANPAMPPYALNNVAGLTEEITSKLVFAAAEALHDNAGFNDNGYGCGEALSDYERAVGEALGEELLTGSQLFEAVSEFRTHQDSKLLDEVSAVVDDRFQELWQEDKKALDME